MYIGCCGQPYSPIVAHKGKVAGAASSVPGGAAGGREKRRKRRGSSWIMTSCKVTWCQNGFLLLWFSFSRPTSSDEQLIWCTVLDRCCFVTSCVTVDMLTLTKAKTLNFFPQRPRWTWKCFLNVDISLVTIFFTLFWCVVLPLCNPSCHFLFSAWNHTSPCAALEDN